MVVPAFHPHKRLLELAASEGMDFFHAFLQPTGIALPWGSVGTLRRWSAQQIDGSSQLPSVHEQRRTTSGGSMLGRVIGHQEIWVMFVPVLVIIGGEEGQLLDEGSIEPLHHTVRLWPQGRCSGLANCQEPAHFF